jgi:hypothetical protein
VDNFIICKSFGLGCSQDYWLDVFAKTSSSLKCFCGPFPQWFIAFGSSCLHQSIMNGLEKLVFVKKIHQWHRNSMHFISQQPFNIGKILPTNIYNVVFFFFC